MYLKGKIETVWEARLSKDITNNFGVPIVLSIPRYVCTVKTAGMQVMKSSVRSRGEALTEALKYLGMPMYTTSQLRSMLGIKSD